MEIPIGERFSKLQVVGRAPNQKNSGNHMFTCKCDCGRYKAVTGSQLRRGKTRSCGCMRTESAARATIAATTHGMKKTPEYAAWNAMKNRCYNMKVPSYASYGGRGVVVCPEWVCANGFPAFYAAMGPRPEGGTLDRIDVNGNYEPANCRWATPVEQQRNKRNTILLTHLGVTKPIRQWEDDLGFPKELLYCRYRKGWTIDRIFATPYQAHKARAQRKSFPKSIAQLTKESYTCLHVNK